MLFWQKAALATKIVQKIKNLAFLYTLQAVYNVNLRCFYSYNLYFLIKNLYP